MPVITHPLFKYFCEFLVDAAEWSPEGIFPPGWTGLIPSASRANDPSMPILMATAEFTPVRKCSCTVQPKTGYSI